MSVEVNLPVVVDEVTQAFKSYNAAIERGDGAALNACFWESPLTVRFGPREHLFGYEEISTFRTGAWKPGAPRAVERLAVTTFGRDMGQTSALFRDVEGKITRQTQVWTRRPEGWRIVAAHVSPFPD